MSGVSLQVLNRILPYATRANLQAYVGPLNRAMEAYGISNLSRQAAFLAQVAHESGSLRYVRELASGEAYDTGRLAQRLGNTPEADGDGQRYKGRGLIQITGRHNYAQCSAALFGDPGILLEYPELLEEPDHAAMSAAWFWGTHGLNELADRGDFDAITQAINGGQNGADERRGHYRQALRALAQA